MAKITKFEIKEPYEGQNSAFVAFDDKGWGIYEYNGNPPFKVGDEVSYKISKETTKNNKTLNRITEIGLVGASPQQPISNTPTPQAPVAKTQPSNIPPATGGKGLADMKHDARIAVIEVLGKLACEGKIEPKAITEYFNEFYPAVDLSYDCIA